MTSKMGPPHAIAPVIEKKTTTKIHTMQASKKTLSSPLLLTQLPPMARQTERAKDDLKLVEKENDRHSPEFNVNGVDVMDASSNDEVLQPFISPKKAEKRGPITPREKIGYPLRTRH